MKIAVIIPFYNESATIIQTLESLKLQTRTPDRVLLIDSGSTDDTSIKINKWISDNNMEAYNIMYSGRMSPSSSVNLGIDDSIEEIIAYIDCGLIIPHNWLSTSEDIINKNNIDLVSTTIFTKGVNNIDKSFVAQTYGYMNNTICLPGSLIKRDVFNKVGTFLDNARANYDIDFINKLKGQNLKRFVNKKIYLEYIDTNYATSFKQASKKVYSYSLGAWNATGDKKPIIYCSFLSIIVICALLNLYKELSIIILLYIFSRSIIIPFVKSNFNITTLNPLNYFNFFMSGIVIDASRLFGYVISIFTRTN